MSMLSNQVDELRAMAVSVGLEMPQAATLMMGAADTIDRLDTENAELREQGARLFDKVLEMGTENDRLQEQLAKAHDPQRIGGTADPESFVYAIEQLREFRWQHATNDEDAIPYINNVADAHERENAKLKDTGRALLQCVRKLNMAVTCEDAGCPVCGDCDLYRLISDPRIEVGA